MPGLIIDWFDAMGDWVGDHPGTLVLVAAGLALATFVLTRHDRRR